MRAAGQLVGHVLHELRRMVEPGIPTIEIDRAAEKMIRDAGALPTFKGYHGFPYSICASINEQVVHGFPSNYKLKEGDWAGILTMAIGLSALQTVLEEGNKDDWFASPFIQRLAAIAFVSLVLFVWIEGTAWVRPMPMAKPLFPS